MPASLQDAITWVVGRIEADATVISLGSTQCLMYSAPEKGVASLPYVIIGKQAGSHTLVNCGVAFDIHYMVVKCVDYGFDGGERARKILHRVRQVIEISNAVTVASGKIDAIQPNSSYSYDEQESGNNNFYHEVQVEKIILSDS